MLTRPVVSTIPTLRLFSILLMVVSLNAQNKKPSNEDKVTDTRLFTSLPDQVKSSQLEAKPGTLMGVIIAVLALGVPGILALICYRHCRSQKPHWVRRF
uniref:Secreted and transmembrane 1A n=1 Tax=Rattus norvegicus TaxID=10116 RepID=A0A8I6AHD3_RAT